MSNHHRIKSTLAVAVVLASGAGAGTASARPDIVNAKGQYVPAPIGVAPVDTQAGSQPTLLRVTPTSGGFDWGDAGIGAVGGFAISMAGLGGALVVTQRRERRPRGSAEAVS